MRPGFENTADGSYSVVRNGDRTVRTRSSKTSEKVPSHHHHQTGHHDHHEANYKGNPQVSATSREHRKSTVSRKEYRKHQNHGNSRPSVSSKGYSHDLWEEWSVKDWCSHLSHSESSNERITPSPTLSNENSAVGWKDWSVKDWSDHLLPSTSRHPLSQIDYGSC